MFVPLADFMNGAIQGAIVGGIAGALAGLCLVVINLFRKPKLCPECQARLPLIPVGKCPKCRCRLNPKGERSADDGTER